MKNKNKIRGSGIVEIGVAIVIIGLLAAMIIPAVEKVRELRLGRLEVESRRSVESQESSFILKEKMATPDGSVCYILRHKRTSILYVFKDSFVTPLLDKDGKPLCAE